MRSDIGRYAIVPEWLLDSGVSSHAVRLFATIAAKYADRQTGEATPSRAALGTDLGGVSVDTIDRATKELLRVGAIQVRSRRDEAGDPTSNCYTLSFIGGRTTAATPPHHSGDGGRTHAALTRITEPELIPTESPKGKPRSLAVQTRPFTTDARESLRAKYASHPDFDGAVRKAMRSPAYQFTRDKYGHVDDWLSRDMQTLGARNANPRSNPETRPYKPNASNVVR